MPGTLGTGSRLSRFPLGLEDTNHDSNQVVDASLRGFEPYGVFSLCCSLPPLNEVKFGWTQRDSFGNHQEGLSMSFPLNAIEQNTRVTFLRIKSKRQKSWSHPFTSIVFQYKGGTQIGSRVALVHPTVTRRLQCTNGCAESPDPVDSGLKRGSL